MSSPPPAPPDHDRAVILSTGDEIITGQLQDSNARWIAEQLVAHGIMPIEHAAVGDSLPDLVATLRRAVDLAPLVIMSGGLGPTDGDLTRPALAELLGEPLVLDEPARAALTDLFARRARPLTDRQLRQVHRPRSATCLPNALGTAPGLHARAATLSAHTHADILALPGPPNELMPMFRQHVRPLLRPPPGRAVVTRLLHVIGIPEADCVALLGDLTRRDRTPLIGVTASGGILTVRIRCESGGRDHAQARVDADEAAIRAILGDHLVSAGAIPGHEALVLAIHAALRERHQTLGTVESCTGGMLGQWLTTPPGASAAFVGGLVTYANELKVRLGVDPVALREHGAVSSIVAEQMALRGFEFTGASFILAITGVAGPDGGTAAKPVGDVHIALASAAAPASVHSRRFLFSGDRDDIRRRASASALAILHFALRGHPPRQPRLLWQVD